MALLFASKTIESLYLENCGLLDDHLDVFAKELPSNHVLGHLFLKDNFLIGQSHGYSDSHLKG